jgi:hypothetical protein
MRVKFAIPLALAILPSGVSAELYIKAQNERITVLASREPLSRVLKGIAQEAGIAVVYQSPAPSQLVTVALENVTPQEALIRLFDGQGLNYIFQLNASGTKVSMLIVAGTASVASRSTGASSHAAPVPAPMYNNEEEAPPEDEPEGDEEVMEQPVAEELAQPQTAPEPSLSNSTWNPPTLGAPPTTFPGAVPNPNQPGIPPGLPTPNFPGAASGAAPPPQPQVPRFPGGASQPQPQP